MTDTHPFNIKEAGVQAMKAMEAANRAKADKRGAGLGTVDLERTVFLGASWGGVGAGNLTRGDFGRRDWGGTGTAFFPAGWVP